MKSVLQFLQKIALIVPIIVGFAFGPEVLGGLLAGVTVSGVLLGMFMNNAGGAWDNAKKSFEKGAVINGETFYKGSEPHKASVTGDTVGDPFKDTSGPSMNILIKLMSIVSLIIAPHIAVNEGHGAEMMNCGDKTECMMDGKDKSACMMDCKDKSECEEHGKMDCCKTMNGDAEHDMTCCKNFKAATGVKCEMDNEGHCVIDSADCARLISEGKMDAKSCKMVDGKCRMSDASCQQMMKGTSK
jgi:Inorganic H+ pyrophosphatase